MHIKLSIIGCFLALMLIASILSIITKKRLLWNSTSLLSVLAIGFRWSQVGHIPMSNIFEAFLWIPFFLPILTFLSKKFDDCDTLRCDAIISSIILFPLCFVLSEQITPLQPALQSPLFGPHVSSYMLAYALLIRGAVISVHNKDCERKSIVAGFFFMTFGLVLGSVWGNEAWGGYWQWDPKEMWSLATWLIYVAWFHQRGKPIFKNLPNILLWIGVAFVILTVTWINLSKLFPGMHNYA